MIIDEENNKVSYKCDYCGIKFQATSAWQEDDYCPHCNTKMDLKNILVGGYNTDPFGYNHKEKQKDTKKGDYFGYKDKKK